MSTVIANSLYAMLTKVNLNDGLQYQGIPTPVVLSITHLFELSSKFHLAELFTHKKKKKMWTKELLKKILFFPITLNSSTLNKMTGKRESDLEFT